MKKFLALLLIAFIACTTVEEVILKRSKGIYEELVEVYKKKGINAAYNSCLALYDDNLCGAVIKQIIKDVSK